MRAGDLSIIRKKNLIEDVNPSADFDLLKWRIDNVGHRFHRETIINAMQATILVFSISTLNCMAKTTSRHKTRPS